MAKRHQGLVLAFAGTACLALTACGGTKQESLFEQGLAKIEICLADKGYAVSRPSFDVIPWLPVFTFIKLPFLSRQVQLPLLTVGWTYGGIGQPSVEVAQFRTARIARSYARQNSRLGIASDRVANFVFDRQPGDDDVAAAIAECIEPASSKRLQHMPWVVQAKGPWATDLVSVVRRSVSKDVARVGCSERPIRDGRTICAVTFADGSCQVWEIVASRPDGMDSAPLAPYDCRIVFGHRPRGLDG